MSSPRAFRAAEQPLSVSEFLAHINELLETQVAWIEGEVSDVRISQGKWLHFDLKDEASLVHCFAFALRVRTPLEDGMKVRVWGVPRVYPKYGKFSLVVERVELSGEGALRRAFELLREKLTHEGLFALERKRSLPRFPERIALVTSPEAAAYSDFLKVLTTRRGGIEVLLLGVPVQGRGAAEAIVRAVEWISEERPDTDALVLVRGGGSLEDLRAFNDEALVRALARSRVPTVVGVGHERDVTLADLVADVRASTPSHAAEVLAPTASETDQALRVLAERLGRAVQGDLSAKGDRVSFSVRALRELSRTALERVAFLARRMGGTGELLRFRARERLVVTRRLQERLQALLSERLGSRFQQLTALDRLLAGLHPARVLGRGYSITRRSDGTLLRSASKANIGETLKTTLHKGDVDSTVASVRP